MTAGPVSAHSPGARNHRDQPTVNHGDRAQNPRTYAAPSTGQADVPNHRRTHELVCSAQSHSAPSFLRVVPVDAIADRHLSAPNQNHRWNPSVACRTSAERISGLTLEEVGPAHQVDRCRLPDPNPPYAVPSCLSSCCNGTETTTMQRFDARNASGATRKDGP